MKERETYMNTNYFDIEDKKRVAHFLAERSVAHITGLDPKTALEKYVETFNTVLETLDKKSN